MQEQLPNPVIIDTVNDPKSFPASEDSCLDNLGKTLVFSAYLLQEKVSNEFREEEDFSRESSVEPCHYPTVFFYDLDKQRIVWEIFGAEMFINITKSKVCVLTNEIWTDKSKEEYDTLVAEAGGEEEFNRHKGFGNYIWKIRYGTDPSADKLSYEERIDQAPSV